MGAAAIHQDQRARAQKLQDLHADSHVLVLPCAWDTGSAVMFDRAGFTAVGTSSAGVAYSYGYPDGETFPFNLLLEFVKRTAEKIATPLTVDIEEGFGRSPETIAKNVAQVIDQGAVGVNLEDHFIPDTRQLLDITAHCQIIQAVAHIKASFEIPFLLNARINTHWYPVTASGDLIDVAIDRGNKCLEAGADCVFVPGVTHPNDIQLLTNEINGPVNILASPKGPSVTALQDLGVSRVSLGSAPARAMLARTSEISDEINESGTFKRLFETAIPYDQANAMFED